MFLVGLTGGIGSGKSTVSAMFQQLGAGIVDTDVIAHLLTAPQGAAIPALRQAFGDDILTAAGALDRLQMRQRVFQDAALRKQLEYILHPLIWAQARQEIAANAAPYVMVVVPLLVENAVWQKRLDRIAVVDCPEQQQIERVMARSVLSRAQVQAIMAAQVTREQRLAAADDVIDNSDGADALEQRILSLHQSYLALAEK